MNAYSQVAADAGMAGTIGEAPVANLTAVNDTAHEPVAIINGRRIRQIAVLRRLRREMFTAYFADAAWDILLALYGAHLDQHRLSIAKLTSRSGVPGTSALRWIASLERGGLLTRTPDVTDNRRVFVTLSEQGAKSMDSFFGACGRDIALL